MKCRIVALFVALALVATVPAWAGKSSTGGLAQRKVGTLTITTRNTPGIVFKSLGGAREGIDLRGAGLSGATDRYFYLSKDDFWRADGDIKVSDDVIITDDLHLSWGSYITREGINAFFFGRDSVELFNHDLKIWNKEATSYSKIQNDNGELVFYSYNAVTGELVKCNLEKFIRRVEEITGEKFMEIVVEK